MKPMIVYYLIEKFESDTNDQKEKDVGDRKPC